MPRIDLVSRDDFQAPAELESAWGVLKRGLRESPELRAGALHTVLLAAVSTGGSLLLPVLIQQILDNGIRAGGEEVRLTFVFALCAVAGVATMGVYLAGRAAFRRLVAASEAALRGLRVRTFRHIHSLSISEQTKERRGVYVSRVTADADTLSRFMEWSAISWITGTTTILGTTAVMFVYSWQLTLVAWVAMAPMTVVLRLLQKGLASSYDDVRTRVGNTLSEISESVMGADVVRAYGLGGRMERRLKNAVDRQYRAQMRAMKFQAMVFPSGNVFGGLAAGAVLFAGVTFGDAWGLSAGRLVAFLFLVNMIMYPLAEMAENFDQTQTAIAGWRKILAVMDIRSEVVEPVDGVMLPTGPLAIEAQGVRYSYTDGKQALRGVDLAVEAGAHVAIVGETGCGKTTFAKLLTRLADPDGGVIRLGGVDLRRVAPESRRSAVRMVPQDGLLFEGTLADNVAYGRSGATRRDVEDALEALELSDWVRSLPRGLDTQVGQRGQALSVGEAQLVALARAQIAEPAILILDEATSAVDPATEKVLAGALERISAGRTTVTIAHRLSTAEAADLVFVFDEGRVVETGAHDALVAQEGTYAALYRSWLGNTRADAIAGDARR
ncbi:MAG TPA: ABC transporter ATP-binding protein [Actinomycetota bacterium]|nr:ABC transporter ATP-binding protein [Actinomycetota bacterium]